MPDDLHANCIPREEFERIVSQLQAQVSQLRAENEALRKLVESLQTRLDRYEGPHVPPSISGRYPRRQPTGRPPGKPEGAPGATRKLEHRKPDETVERKPEKCRKCNAKLGEPVAWDTQLVQEIPKPQPAKLIEFKRGIAICQCCGAETIGTDPRCPIKGDFGPAALALIQDLRIRERLSLSMVRRFLKERFGLELSERAVIDATSRTADLLKAEHNELAMRMRGALAVYVDETGHKFNGKRIWMWVFATDRDILVVLDESRGSGVPRRILGDDFRGVVVSDCFSAYELLAKHAAKARYQKCWAHLLREAERLSEKYLEAKDLYAKLKDRFSRMKAFLNTDPDALSRERFHAESLAWLDEIAKIHSGERKIANLIKRMAKYREHWFTCILARCAQPTNNYAERCIRPQVILRKLRGSFRSEFGMEDHSVLASLMSTWQQRGLDPALQMESELCEIFTEGGIM